MYLKGYNYYMEICVYTIPLFCSLYLFLLKFYAIFRNLRICILLLRNSLFRMPEFIKLLAQKITLLKFLDFYQYNSSLLFSSLAKSL